MPVHPGTRRGRLSGVGPFSSIRTPFGGSFLRYRNHPGAEPGEDSLLSIPEQRSGAGPPPGEGAIAPDVGVQDVLQCATRHYRHRTGAEDSQTPVRNSDPMAVDGLIPRSSGATSWQHRPHRRGALLSYRSDNPICARTGTRACGSWLGRRGTPLRDRCLRDRHRGFLTP